MSNTTKSRNDFWTLSNVIELQITSGRSMYVVFAFSTSSKWVLRKELICIKAEWGQHESEEQRLLYCWFISVSSLYPVQVPARLWAAIMPPQCPVPLVAVKWAVSDSCWPNQGVWQESLGGRMHGKNQKLGSNYPHADASPHCFQVEYVQTTWFQFPSVKISLFWPRNWGSTMSNIS